MQAQD